MIKRIQIIIILTLVFQLTAFTQTSEYMLKAGFLEKFARFTEWPKTNKTAFKICVLGKNPFKKDLDKMYSTVKIKNLTVKLEYIENINELADSDILFISSSERSKLSEILKKTESKPVLTVSDTRGFAQKGVIINFYETNQGTIHFEINKTSLAKSGLKMDFMLLQLAKIID